MPAMGVRAPLLMLVIVRAIAPVTGIPPKKGTMMFATPWAISSVFERWRSPMTPSATLAERRDSIAPRRAMVKAGPMRCCIVAQLSSGTTRSGIFEEIV